MERQTAIRNGETGQFASAVCPDPNCGGRLVASVDRFGQPEWRCDGLTYHTATSPLTDCRETMPRKGCE